MEPIIHILAQLDFFSYLNKKTVIILDNTSHLIHLYVLPHISRHITFCVPAFFNGISTHPFSLSSPQYAKRLKWNLASNVENISFLSQFPLTHLTLWGEFNAPVNNELPNSITYLKFGDSFNQNVDHLPTNLIYLRFGHNFDKGVKKLPKTLLCLILNKTNFSHSLDSLPPSLKVLHINRGYKKLLHHLPDSLKELKVYNFANYAGNSLPSSMEKLSCGKFNTGTIILPNSLIYLCMDGEQYDRVEFPKSLKHLNVVHYYPTESCIPSASRVYDNLVNRLPPSITYLEFQETFNSPVDNLPKSLKHLVFGPGFNQNVDNLPPSLLSLSFSLTFDQPVDKLPSTLIDLTIDGKFKRSVNSLPPLKKLSLTYSVLQNAYDIFKEEIKLPESLKSLELSYYFQTRQDEIDNESNVQYVIDHLPQYLTTLFLHCAAPRVDHLPPFLTHLDIFGCKQIESLDHLPIFLKELRVGCHDACFDNLPENLSKLSISNIYCNKNLDHLPGSLKHLLFHSKQFNHNLDNLPSSLIFLKLGLSYNIPLDHLPNGLIRLELGVGFDQSIDYFPKSLRHLKITEDYIPFVHSVFPDIIDCTWIRLQG